MNYKLVILLCMFFTIPLTSQVETVTYVLEHNCETAQYDVKLRITEGSATAVNERIQFNAQISIVVPTEFATEIVERFAPIIDNADYMGTEVMQWQIGNSEIDPSEIPGYDVYSIIPVLSPVASYDDLHQGDEVHLFSFTAGENIEYDDRIRLWNNETDYIDFEFSGQTFDNSFTLGSFIQLYEGNVHSSCLTGTVDNIFLAHDVFPNPVSRDLFVQIPKDVLDVEIIDAHGNLIYFYKREMHQEEIIRVDMASFTNGLYFLKIIGSSSIEVQQIVKY